MKRIWIKGSIFIIRDALFYALGHSKKGCQQSRRVHDIREGKMNFFYSIAQTHAERICRIGGVREGKMNFFYLIAQTVAGEIRH